MQINSSGIVLNIGQSENEKWEKQNGHIRAADHIILLEFSDGYHFVGYYELVAGETLALIDFETGARKVFHCKKTDYSKQIVGNWFGIGEENTFIHSFNADGSMTGMIKSHSAISQDGSKLWNIGDGQYSLLGNILHIKYAKQSYLTTIDIAENTPW